MYFARDSATEWRTESTVSAALPLEARAWFVRVTIVFSSVAEKVSDVHAAAGLALSRSSATRAAPIARGPLSREWLVRRATESVNVLLACGARDPREAPMARHRYRRCVHPPGS